MNQEKKFLVSEIKISYHPKIKPSERIAVKDSKSAYEVFLANWEIETIYLVEHFKIMCLNRANKVLGVYPIGVGGIAGVIADPKIIFLTALSKITSSIIMAHNHPSGSLEPSQTDIEMTRKIKQFGKLIDMKVVDHLIISPDGYTSLADEGEM